MFPALGIPLLVLAAISSIFAIPPQLQSLDRLSEEERLSLYRSAKQHAADLVHERKSGRLLPKDFVEACHRSREVWTACAVDSETAYLLLRNATLAYQHEFERVSDFHFITANYDPPRAQTHARILQLFRHVHFFEAAYKMNYGKLSFNETFGIRETNHRPVSPINNKIFDDMLRRLGAIWEDYGTIDFSFDTYSIFHVWTQKYEYYWPKVIALMPEIIDNLEDRYQDIEKRYNNLAKFLTSRCPKYNRLKLANSKERINDFHPKFMHWLGLTKTMFLDCCFADDPEGNFKGSIQALEGRLDHIKKSKSWILVGLLKMVYRGPLRWMLGVVSRHELLMRLDWVDLIEEDDSSQ